MYTPHINKRIQELITRLSDELCSWERSTGVQSVLIIKEDRGFEYRASSGKPIPTKEDGTSDLSDIELINLLGLK